MIRLAFIIYCIIAVIWFDWLSKYFRATDRKGKEISVYNDKLFLFLAILIAASWIVSIPIYILPLRREYK